ncbi:MAG: AAA family ATPase [Candidatus Desulforudis sp.]|nr:AAA family ATPase [Desulforudis sp.]
MVVAVYSAKGGVGRTVLAGNLAMAAVSRRSRVALMDLNLSFGGAEVLLDMEPAKTLADLFPVLLELNEQHLLNMAVRHASGVHLLASPVSTAWVDRLGRDEVAALVQACREAFDLTLIDLPADLNPGTLGGVAEADHILFVVTPDVLSVRALQVSLTALGDYGLGLETRASLLVNRVDKLAEVSVDDIAKLTGLPVFGQVRSDYRRIRTPVNLGMPLVPGGGKKARTAVGSDLQALAERLTG